MAKTALAIDHVPAKVRRHGLQEAHAFPMVSHGKRNGEYSRPRHVSTREGWQAWSEIQIATPNSWPALVLDLDGKDAVMEYVESVLRGDMPGYNWLTERRTTGSAHAVYCLRRPVLRGAGARWKPLAKLKRISEYYVRAAHADPANAQVMTHNPMSVASGERYRTAWGREEGYTLGELARVIPLGWRAPKLVHSGIGRNVTLFESLCRWAGQKKHEGMDLLAAAHAANGDFDHPLSLPELSGIVRSVERYRAQWTSRGWHSASFLGKQASRGRKAGIASGASRRKGTPLEHDREPWVTAGVSRRTWYRHHRENFGTEPNTDDLPEGPAGGSGR